MTAHDAESMLAEITGSAHADLVGELLASAVRYARIRTDWRFLGHADRLDQNASRTAAHNAFIGACNALSRAMTKTGEGAEWRRSLGDDRQIIGDFACHIHCLLGLASK